MPELISFLQMLGNLSVNYFWFPLIVWTIIALPTALFLQQSDSVPPVYQYHSRLALLFALPLGILGSYVTGLFGQTMETTIASTKLIVVQNPITTTAPAQDVTQTVNLSDPFVWIGLLEIVAMLGTLYFLIRIISNSYSLKRMDRKLNFIPISQIQDLNISIPNNRISEKTFVAFSDEVDIPFTYGWIINRIVMPGTLQHDPQKYSMALQHELMHIKHRDFMLNGIQLMVMALFWFHPLIHYLYNSGREYREITCDTEVLAENNFSKKSYATLLVQLAEKDYRNNRLAMSMAVKPSTLKKRIQIMSEYSTNKSSFRSSLILTMVTAGLLVATISCSDISDNGITNSEFQEAQVQMKANADTKEQPLYILNGERITETNPPDALSRIKSKYIKTIEVLKGQEARNQYGQAGKNGVIEIQLIDGIDENTVFTDLKAPPQPTEPADVDNLPSINEPETPPSPSEDYYVAVEEMPKLIGGLASLQKRIDYPTKAREAGIQGRVIVQFIVNKQGEVENPQIIQGIGGGCDEEALRVVQQAEFEPGTQRGEPVRVQYSLPITYRLAGDTNASEKQSSIMLESENSLEEIAIIGYI